MHDSPLISIALPALNAESTVGDAIASILMQTYGNWELLFIDDGSSDRTVSIARRFTDARIKVIADGSNRGLASRLNEAMAKSSGKYFARMDADDICFPNRLRQQVEFLESHPDVDLVGGGAMTFMTPGVAVGLFPLRETHAEICRRPWNGFYLPHPTWMGKLEWFRKNRYSMPEVRRAEDQDLLLRSYPASRFACVPNVLLAYRLRDRISLSIRLTARTNLLKSQARYFAARAQWRYLVLAFFAYAAKCGKDLYAVMFGMKRFPADPEVERLQPQWADLRKKLTQFAEKASAQT